jgi:hypothetical protein
MSGAGSAGTRPRIRSHDRIVRLIGTRGRRSAVGERRKKLRGKLPQEAGRRTVRPSDGVTVGDHLGTEKGRRPHCSTQSNGIIFAQGSIEAAVRSFSGNVPQVSGAIVVHPEQLPLGSPPDCSGIVVQSLA